jgi:uncharacterized membrane protein YczE
MAVYLNLLMMTARIKRTRTVMMAIVIILFVAILISVSLRLLDGCKEESQHYLRAICFNVLLLLSV